MADKKTDDAPKVKEVESNHNSLSPAKPVPNGNLMDKDGNLTKPDYNPMRAPGNKANDKSDVTMTPDLAEELVGTKGDRPPPTAPDDMPQPKPGTAEAEEKKDTQ